MAIKKLLGGSQNESMVFEIQIVIIFEEESECGSWEES